VLYAQPPVLNEGSEKTVSVVVTTHIREVVDVGTFTYE
jgi:hypothetical protein